MKTYKFEPYFTGAPLVRVEFSYNETTMFRNVGGVVASVDITEEQLSELNRCIQTNKCEPRRFSERRMDRSAIEMRRAPISDGRATSRADAN